MMDRRKFIKLSMGGAALASIVTSCRHDHTIRGAIVGASSGTGHRLRDQQFGAPVSKRRHKTVIAGAGVSGLSAAYFLHRYGEGDFVLLDLENVPGGNARWGSNEISAFPWGAHYVPVPNNNLTEYLNFLKECQVITGLDPQGLPVYNDYYLCFDPQERLYINGKWQEGLVPRFGVPAAEEKQIQDFLALMDQYRHQKGSDGRDAFAIPINDSSTDQAFVSLDTLTMKAWMLEKGFDSPYLQWYVNYCTRDDFGTTFDVISAWTGIHYFAARKGSGANAANHDVLTWPEGNGFLVKQLAKDIEGKIETGKMVVEVKQDERSVTIVYYDNADHQVKAIEAEQCILAVPQFIAARVLKDEERRSKAEAHFHYMPWMVANLKVKTLVERSGAPLSWDNVIYGSSSLGYVEATHGLIQQKTMARNLTWYAPLTHLPPKQARQEAYQKSYEYWKEMVLSDLLIIHPNIREATEELNVMLWGHAMVQPLPGIVHGNVRKELAASLGRIHFAHTDLSGASIFEEAFYQGLNAARKVVKINTNA